MKSQELQVFENQNMMKRMSVLADKFKIPNNQDLYKKRYPTGFSGLDEILNGGLTAGLHCIGAISSLGKSTLVMQMADHAAEKGTHCIVFSLEMKAVDLTAKSISRQMYIDNVAEPGLAKTSDSFMNENVASKFSEREWRAIERAADVVSKRGENVTVIECGAEPYSVDRIGKYVQDWIQCFKDIPLVVVDYLQILDAPDSLKSATDKQVADYNLKRLKVLSDYFNVPIIIISSFNRENYNTEVSFKAFKDSGNIEYSCDTVLGLQLTGTGSSDFDVEKAKSEYPRKIDLCVLKQRYGAVGDKVQFKFYTRYNYFEEIEFKKLDRFAEPFEEKKGKSNRRVY